MIKCLNKKIVIQPFFIKTIIYYKDLYFKKLLNKDNYNILTF